MSIAVVCYKCKDNVWNPRCQYWWRVGINGKGGADCLQHNISKTQCQSDAKI